MKKLLSLLIVTILLMANAQLAFAQGMDLDEDRSSTETEEPSNQDLIRECRRGCNEEFSGLENREARNACRATCEETYSEEEDVEYTEVGEIGSEGETKRTILPPIIKPDLLPGPNLEERTGNEVVGFITGKFLPTIAARLTTIVAVIALGGIVYSGAMFFMSYGQTEKIQKAQRTALYSVAGLVLALLSFTIIQIVNLLPFG